VKDQLKKAQDAPKRGYSSVRDNVDTITPVVRRIVEDKRTRDALRDLVAAGRDVREQLRRDGGSMLIRDHARKGRLREDLEGSAKALQAAADQMAKSRSRVKRRRGIRLVGVLAVLGGIGVAVKKALGSRRQSWNDEPHDAASQWAASPAPPAAAGNSSEGVDRPSGAPIRTS
jgi:hypothetical protein